MPKIFKTSLTDVSAYLPLVGGTMLGHIYAGTDVTYDIGSSTKYFKDIYAQKVYLNTNVYIWANWPYTPAVSIEFPDGRNFYIGGTDGDYLAFNTSASPHSFYPSGNNTFNLGRSGNYWAEIYSQDWFLNATAYFRGNIAGHILFTGDLVPATDDTEWVGEIGTPFKSIKGLVIKDTTNGKHYSVTVVNGTLTTTALD